MANRSIQVLSILVASILGTGGAHAANNTVSTKTCSLSNYSNSAENNCASNASYDEACLNKRTTCFAENSTKKSVCLSKIKACASGLYALRKEAAQCKWRHRMDKVFTTNELDDGVKNACKTMLKNNRTTDLATEKRLYTEFNSATKAESVIP